MASKATPVKAPQKATPVKAKAAQKEIPIHVELSRSFDVLLDVQTFIEVKRADCEDCVREPSNNYGVAIRIDMPLSGTGEDDATPSMPTAVLNEVCKAYAQTFTHPELVTVTAGQVSACPTNDGSKTFRVSL